MLNKLIKDIAIFLRRYFLNNPWTNVYGLSRSIIAISLLCTIIFSGKNVLFPIIDEELLKQPIFEIDKLSLFWIMRNHLNLALGLSIIILISVISGYLPQITGLFHWWVTFSYTVSGILIEGGDQIASIITLLLIPITMSDNRLNHWKSPKKCDRKYLKFAMWSVFSIITLQISLIYFHSAIAKLEVDEWLNGTAVYYWFTHNIFGVNDSLKPYVFKALSHVSIVTTITWVVILFEILWFSWIFMKRSFWNWKFLFLSAVLFHLGTALIHGLASFFLTMTGTLVLYFFPKHLNIKIWS